MDCKIVEITSKKTGKTYLCIEVQITEDYKKVVFLNDAEAALVKATYNK